MTFEKWLQSRLTAHGYPCGMIDGVIGPITVKALQAFEASRGLTPDGIADEATVTELRKSASTVTSSIRRGIAADDEPAIPVIKTLWPRQPDVARFFGKVGTNQIQIALPYPMFLAWDKDTKITRMTLHEKVAESASRCFERIADAYDEGARTKLGIDLFGGSLNVRRMRGGKSYSMHSWGIAIDFDPERNQLKWGRDKARLAMSDAETFWRIWEDEGWVSLGRARNFDWMHVQAARL